MVDLASLGITALAGLFHNGSDPSLHIAAKAKELDEPVGIEAYLHVGESQTADSRLQKAYAAYMNAYRSGKLQPDRLNGLVNELVDILKAKIVCESDAAPRDRQATSDDDSTTSEDGFTCLLCHNVWYEPTTVECGHTYCRACLDGQSRCVQCDAKHRPVSAFKTNVLLAKVAENCFPEKVAATKLKQEANRHGVKRQRDTDTSSTTTTTTTTTTTAPAEKGSSDDSRVAFIEADVGRYHEALAKAQSTIKLKPDWPKGYYHWGSALSGLGLDQYAVVAYLQCLALDPNMASAKTDLTKALQRVLSPLPAASNQKVEPQGLLCAKSLARLFSEDSSLTSRPLCGCKRSKLTTKTTTKTTTTTMTMTPARLLNTPDDVLPPPAVPVQLLSRKRSLAEANSTHCVQLATARTKLSRSRPAGTLLARHTASSTLTKEDLECSLCLRLLHNPVATPCGHVFCRDCLYRCLDHNVTCPLCKGSLAEYLAERRQSVTESVLRLLETHFSCEAADRRLHEEREVSEAMITGDDLIQEIPIFVCTLAYPTVPCPLHVYEPRYRLMVRRCMQAGSAQFGMCVCLDDAEENYSEFGCTVEVRSIQYLADGRSVVDTVGGRRFRVLERSVKDGYHVARVQFLQDQPADHTTVGCADQLTSVYAAASAWLAGLPHQPRARILHHFGALPPPTRTAGGAAGPAWLWWLTAVLPVDRRVQLWLLSCTALPDRLSALQRILAAMRRAH